MPIKSFAAAMALVPLTVFSPVLPATATTPQYPRVGTIVKLENGDLMCYATVVVRGKSYSLGASFSICERESQLLNKRVRLTYRRSRVNDCQSAEPCGRTRIVNLIVNAQILR
jgi:hypothetical protein